MGDIKMADRLNYVVADVNDLLNNNDEISIGDMSKVADEVIDDLAELVAKQGKSIHVDRQGVLNNIKILCIVYDDETPIAIGGLKKGKNFEYAFRKINKLDLINEYDYEIGYFYTEKSYRGKMIEIGNSNLPIFIGIIKLLINFAGKNKNYCFTMLQSRTKKFENLFKKNGYNLLGKYPSITAAGDYVTLWGNHNND